MKFAIASVSYWDSIGMDSTKWRKSLDGTKALCHLSYAERLGINLHATPEVAIYDNVDTEFEELLSSPEWSETSATGDPDSFSILNELNQFETNINNAVSQKTADLTAQLQQTEQDLTDQMNTAVGAVTVDSEVVLARGGENTLGNRLDSIEKDKVTLKSLVDNGDFSNGTTGWGFIRGTPQAGSGTVIFTPTDIASRLSRQTNVIINHVYYHAMRVKATGSTPMIYPTSPASSSQPIKGTGEWEMVSVNHKPTVSSVEIRYVYNGTIGVPIEVDWIIGINLTATFGAGNEPSKEWMDRLIEQTGYFDEHILNENWQVGEIARLDDTKVNKHQEDWITPTLLNGAITTEGSPVGYMKDEMGFVRFKGRIKGPSGVLLFNVAGGYNFSLQQGTPKRFPALTSTTRMLADVQINHAGSVYASAINDDTWIYLDGVSYKAGD